MKHCNALRVCLNFCFGNEHFFIEKLNKNLQPSQVVSSLIAFPLWCHGMNSFSRFSLAISLPQTEKFGKFKIIIPILSITKQPTLFNMLYMNLYTVVIYIGENEESKRMIKTWNDGKVCVRNVFNFKFLLKIILLIGFYYGALGLFQNKWYLHILRF